MKVKNGYVWSSKHKRWRKLPRMAWLRIMADHNYKVMQRAKNKPSGDKS